MKKVGFAWVLAILGIGGCSGRGEAPLLVAEIAAAKIGAEVAGPVADVAQAVTEPAAVMAQVPPDTASPQQTMLHVSVPASRAEQVMEALAAAYPDRVGQAELRNGDWAVPVYGEWFYYAEGRLLPEKLRSNFADYASQPFYQYPQNLPE